LSVTQLAPGAVESHPAPGPEEHLAGERALLKRHAKHPTETCREELVQRFMPLARRLARRYAGRAEPLDDLVQVASLGLVKAVDRFDPSRGTAFSTFAVPTILGELKRHFRDRGWSIRVPRGTQELILKVEKARSELPGRLNREPTVQDIARWLEVSDEEVLDAMHASQGHHATSLDRPASAEADDGMTLVERLGGEDPMLDTIEYAVAIEPILDEITDRDRQILHLRFVEDLTQSEIAKKVGISQMHVSRLLRQVVERLRAGVDEERSDERSPSNGAGP
jgi:RNA polymerase sigma-B factor